MTETEKSNDDSKEQVKKNPVDEKEEVKQDVKEDGVNEKSEVKEDLKKTDNAEVSTASEQKTDVEEKPVLPAEEKDKRENVKTPEETVADKKASDAKKISEEKKPKKEDEKKKDKHKDDFRYIVRIANTDIDGEKKIIYGLSEIKGIGVHLATLISNEAKLDKSIKMGDLTDAQIEKISQVLEKINEIAPSWMLNHRKDNETGDDIHLLGSEIDMRHRDEINVMKKIRSYRGIRHEMGLRVRGQKTKANNRSGLTLGVSRKSVKQGK